MKAGTKVGPYRIIEALGAGGMGEVFLAEDTTLGREIAIKTLPAALSSDKERLARFQQEARLLASINHPNIATVYGLEKFDEVRFFTQELVRGETLAKRIERAPIEITEVIEIGIQIADALAAAHEGGVVHRDFKPSNVMLDEQGRVKVLDFGLAKPVADDDEEGAVQSESTPTISSIRPEGVILGTAAYMSPDQARGRSVDHRTDVWAFGCVLFECLTGERAFDGDTLLDTLANVVRGEPEWDRLPDDAPLKLRDLIRRCLRKKSRDRLHHLADARIELQEVLDDPYPESRDAAAAAPTRAGGRGAGVAMAALLVGIVLGAAGGRFLVPPEPGVPRASLAIPLGSTGLYEEQFSDIALSPDGTRLVYAAGDLESRQLFLRTMEAFDPIPIPDTGGAINPFFSPDGEWLAFFANGKLMRVLVDGGVPQPVCDVNVNSAGGVWLPDGTIVFGTLFTGSGLMRVDAEGGEAEPLTIPNTEAGEVSHEWPRGIPGGDGIVYGVTTNDGPIVVARSLTTGQQRTILQGTGDARVAPGGTLVYAQAGALFAVEFDAEALAVSGSPVRIAEGVRTTSAPAHSHYALGDNGTLVYVPGDVQGPRHELVWVERDGTGTPLPTPLGEYGHPRLSPDGTQVAVNATHEERVDIWVYDVERGSGTRLTREGSNLMPVWSPDGESIAFNSNRAGPAALFRTRADGEGVDEEVFRREVALWPRSWGPDDVLLFYSLEPDTGRDIWFLSMGDQPPQAQSFLATPASERSPVFSPDGRWVAYVSDETGRDEVYVRRFGEEGRRATISTLGGTEPVWAADGSELFYRAGDSMMMVRVAARERFRAEQPTALFTGAYATTNVGNQYYDVTADGRFLMIREDDSSPAADHFRIVFDWLGATAAGAITPD